MRSSSTAHSGFSRNPKPPPLGSGVFTRIFPYAAIRYAINQSRLLIDICLEDSVACTVFKRTNFKVSPPPLVPARYRFSRNDVVQDLQGVVRAGQMFGLLAGV